MDNPKHDALLLPTIVGGGVKKEWSGDHIEPTCMISCCYNTFLWFRNFHHKTKFP